MTALRFVKNVLKSKVVQPEQNKQTVFYVSYAENRVLLKTTLSKSQSQTY